MHAVSRAPDRRPVGPQLHRSASTIVVDRPQRQVREDQSDCDDGRRSRALLMLAPVFGLAIWGALIALVI